MHGPSTASFVRRLVALLLVFAATGAPAREISSWAIVNEDATLRIKGRTVHLYGIHIPDGGYTCAQNRRPPVCGSRASIALDFKVKGFIRCDIRGERPDRSLIGWCRVGAGRFDDGEDLSAYLLERGWAVALPDAPVDYQALEKIARNRGMGVWGFPVDRVVQ